MELWRNENLFCHDLPSTPCAGMGKVLVTGASGYIGGRLVPELCARGYQVRVMVRKASPEQHCLWPEAEIVVADAMKLDSLIDALAGVHIFPPAGADRKAMLMAQVGEHLPLRSR